MGGGGGGSTEDHNRRIQAQLLTDVSSARRRQKHNFILESLRQSMVVKRTVRPNYGEVLVYEYEFQNPYPQEQVRGDSKRSGVLGSRAIPYRVHFL